MKKLERQIHEEEERWPSPKDQLRIIELPALTAGNQPVIRHCLAKPLETLLHGLLTRGRGLQAIPVFRRCVQKIIRQDGAFVGGC